MDGGEQSYQLHLHTTKCVNNFCGGRNTQIRFNSPYLQSPSAADLCQIYYEGCSYSRILSSLTFVPTFPLSAKINRNTPQSPAMSQPIPPRKAAPTNSSRKFTTPTATWFPPIERPHLLPNTPQTSGQKTPNRYKKGQPVLTNCVICGYQFCKSWHLEYDLGELYYGKQQMCHPCYMANQKLKSNSQYASEIVCFFNKILEKEQTLRSNTNFDYVQGTSFIQNVEIEDFFLKSGDGYLGNLKLDPNLVTARRSELEHTITNNANLSPDIETSDILNEVIPEHGDAEMQIDPSDNWNDSVNEPEPTTEISIIQAPEPCPSSSKPCTSTNVDSVQTQSTDALIEIKPHRPFPLGDWSKTRVVNSSIANAVTDKKYDWGLSAVPMNALNFLQGNKLVDTKGGIVVNHGITLQVSLKLVQDVVKNFYVPNTVKIINQDPDQNSPHCDLTRFSINWTRRMGASAEVENSIVIHERETDTTLQVEIPDGGVLRYNSVTQEQLYKTYYQKDQSGDQGSPTPD